MKKSVVSVLTLAIMSAGAFLPALADDDGMLKNTAMFPVRVLGVGTGLVVGVPVAVFKKVAGNSIDKTGEVADSIGGKQHIPPQIFASVIGIPFGVVSGTMEGVYYGSRNALSSGISAPFSQASMSFTDLDADKH